MSRRHHSMRTPLRRAALAVISSVGIAALTLTGCSAGQVTQTDTQVAAVDGASADLGDIALRDALLAYPQKQRSGAEGTYPRGSDVPLQVTIVNDGTAPDTLVAVRTPSATRVVVQGRSTLPPGTSVISLAGITHSGGSATTSPSASASAAPTTAPTTPTSPAPPGASAAPAAPAPSAAPGTTASGGPSAQPPSPLDVGELRIVLSDTTRELRAGLNTDITFVFRNAGEVTLSVPMASPTHGTREHEEEAGGAGGH